MIQGAGLDPIIRASRNLGKHKLVLPRMAREIAFEAAWRTTGHRFFGGFMGKWAIEAKHSSPCGCWPL